MIKNILFDLDDTLLDFHRSEAAALSEALRRMGLTATDAILPPYSAINKAQWEALERAELTRAEVLTRRFALLFAELGVNCSPDEAQAWYEDLLSRQHFLLPGATELLDELKEQYTMAVVSNGTAVVQDRRLAESGLFPFFKYIFISQRVGFDKPQKAFFDACFETMPGVKREECLIVGDSLTSDMLGGFRAGIPTCWYNPGRKPGCADIPVDYEIHRLEELPELLAKIP